MKSIQIITALLFLLTPGIAPCESISVYYPNRPPYNYTVDGKATGPLVELTEMIFLDAGLEPSFIEMPSPRILAELQNPESLCCSFGWFKNPAREAYASFTLPITQDTPLVALILTKNERLFSGISSFEEVAAHNTLVLGLIQGWSYGGYVDGVIKSKDVRVMNIPERQQQAKMLANGRFTYTLVRESEVEEVIKLSGKAEEDFSVLHLSDTQESSKRYILCGKGVSNEVIARINASIAKICDVKE